MKEKCLFKWVSELIFKEQKLINYLNASALKCKKGESDLTFDEGLKNS